MAGFVYELLLLLLLLLLYYYYCCYNLYIKSHAICLQVSFKEFKYPLIPTCYFFVNKLNPFITIFFKTNLWDKYGPVVVKGLKVKVVLFYMIIISNPQSLNSSLSFCLENITINYFFIWLIQEESNSEILAPPKDRGRSLDSKYKRKRLRGNNNRDPHRTPNPWWKCAGLKPVVRLPSESSQHRTNFLYTSICYQTDRKERLRERIYFASFFCYTHTFLFIFGLGIAFFLCLTNLDILKPLWR